MSAEIQDTLPLCLRDSDLDCPKTCPLNPVARNVTEGMAKDNGMTVEDFKTLVRGFSQITRVEMRFIHKIVLKFFGHSQTCAHWSDVKEDRIGFDQ